MHDPETVAHEIKYPWWKHRPWPKSLRKMSDRKVARDIASKIEGCSSMWPEGYRETFITIWHVDPCIRGSDDSCGWFKRAHHGDKDVLERIIKRFDDDWDRTFVGDKGKGKHYHLGFFYPENEGAGMPNMSVTAIALNLFFLAIGEYFIEDGRQNWKRSHKWMQRNLFDIMFFAENPTDSLRDSLVKKWGDSDKREERIRHIAAVIYGWILRRETPWWQHPRWHIHHWKFQCHPLQMFKRWAFSRCCKCRQRVGWTTNVVSHQWDSTGPQWFRSETGIECAKCSGFCGVAQSATKSA